MAGQAEAVNLSDCLSIDSICCPLNGDGHHSKDQAALLKLKASIIQLSQATKGAHSPADDSVFRLLNSSNDNHSDISHQSPGDTCSASVNHLKSVTRTSIGGSASERRQTFRQSGEQPEIDEDKEEVLLRNCPVTSVSVTGNVEDSPRPEGLMHGDHRRVKTKSDIEGHAHDPKLKQLSRKVSFSKQISVQDERGLCEMVPEGGLDGIRGDNLNSPGLFNEVFLYEGSEPNNPSKHFSRSCSENGHERRQKFSDKTSGYGTGDSDKNSQNSSIDQQKDNRDLDTEPGESFESTESSEQCTCTSGFSINSGATKGESNVPMLSILDKTFSNNSVGNPCFAHVLEINKECTFNSSSSNQINGLPNLSIFNDTESRDPDNDSVVLSHTAPSGNLSSSSASLPDTLPPEVLAHLSSPDDPPKHIRDSDSDNQALKALEAYRRWNSSPASSPRTPDSGALSHNSHRPLCKSNTFPLNHMEEELVIEQMRLVIEQMDPNQSASLIEAKVKAVCQPPSDSSSPLTPLTPHLTKDCTAPSCDSGRDSAENQQPCPDSTDRFPFSSSQTLELCREGKEVQTQILRASRCSYCRCSDPSCKLGKRLLHELELSLLTNPSHVTRANHALTILSLLDHSWNCDELRCSVPWCTVLQKYYNGLADYTEARLDQLTLELTGVVQSPTLQFSSLPSTPSPTCKLSSQLPYSSVTEGVHWLPLVRLGRLGSCVLAMDGQTLQHWVLKKEYLSHRDDGRLEVYGLLRDHTCPHIVTWLWMKQCDKLLYVCSAAELGPWNNLHDLVQSQGHLPDRLALTYFSQILQAAVFLHMRGILYLYWSGENVVFDACGVAKLCNFSAAVCQSRSVDVEMVSCVVPPTLLPPELLGGENEGISELSPAVDSWGLGCLLSELLMGVSPRQDIIHEDRASIIDQLTQSPVPTVCCNNSVVQNILLHCWMINPTERKTADELVKIVRLYFPTVS